MKNTSKTPVENNVADVALGQPSKKLITSPVIANKTTLNTKVVDKLIDGVGTKIAKENSIQTVTQMRPVNIRTIEVAKPKPKVAPEPQIERSRSPPVPNSDDESPMPVNNDNIIDNDDDDEVDDPEAEEERRNQTRWDQFTKDNGLENNGFIIDDMDDDDGNSELGARPSDMSIKQALTIYEDLRRIWLIEPNMNLQGDLEKTAKYIAAFGVNTTLLDDNEIDTRKHEWTLKIDAVSEILTQFSFKNEGADLKKGLRKLRGLPDDAVVEDVRPQLTRLSEVCHSTSELLSLMHRQKTSSMGNVAENRHIAKLDSEFLDEKQKLLNMLYDKCASKRYRKYKDGKLYEPVYTKDGHHTHAYKLATRNTKTKLCKDEEDGTAPEKRDSGLTIYEFVHRMCQRVLAANNWRYVTSSRRSTASVIGDLTDTLTTMVDSQLPDLVQDRHKFSFTNGVFITRQLRTNTDGQKIATCKFYRYESDEFGNLEPSVASAKYFDQPFTEHPEDEDWWHAFGDCVEGIQTPVLEYTLHYQFGHRNDFEEISRMMYIQIGRMLFSRGDLDNWQIMVHLLGIAGTGKSTLVEHVLKYFYEAHHRAEIDNKIESQFGLGGLIKGREIFITTSAELDATCQLDTPAVLKMCSGEEITAAIKNGDPITFTWPSHWMSAENTFPAAWKDQGGNVLRRMVMFEYRKRISDADMQGDLKDRLFLEIPNIIHKSVRAYLEAVNAYGRYSKNNKGFWAFCPKYFSETRENLSSVTNHFKTYMMESGRITFSETLVVSEPEVYADFRDWCKSRGARGEIRNKDIVYDTFIQETNERRGLALRSQLHSHFQYEDKTVYTNQVYFFGFGLTSKLNEQEKAAIYEKNSALHPELIAPDTQGDSFFVQTTFDDYEPSDILIEKGKEEEVEEILEENEDQEQQVDELV